MSGGGLLADDAPLAEPSGPVVGVLGCSHVAPGLVRASVGPVGLDERFLQFVQFGGPQDVYHWVSGVQIHLGVKVHLVSPDSDRPFVVHCRVLPWDFGQRLELQG